ncbi:MAG: hypothetical protein AAF988_06580 [Pseudomonadota bacterium]
MQADDWFALYKRKSKEARKLATHFWVIELMRVNQVNHIAGLLKKLELLKERRVETARERGSNFWYLKFKMNELSHANKVANIESYFPGSHWVLIHPIWQLLTGTPVLNADMKHALLSICKNKDLNIEEKRSSYANTIRTLGKMNNFDGLFALLMLQAQLHPRSEYAGFVNQEAFSLFCRLMTISFPSKPLTVETLFEAIESRVYLHYVSDEPASPSTLNTHEKLSLQCQAFEQRMNKCDMFQFIQGLKTLMEKLQKNWLSKSTLTEQHLFLAETLKSNVAALYDEIDARHQNTHGSLVNKITQRVRASKEN